MEKTETHVVFRKDLRELEGVDNSTVAPIDSRYILKRFKPTWLHLMPKGVSTNPATLAVAFQYLVTPKRKSKSVEYYLLYDGERVVHCCVVTPKYYRFPFMGNDDINLSFFTLSRYRGQGICPFIIRKAMEDYRSRNRYAYVVTAEDNMPARRSAEKAGLGVYGYYGKPKRFWRKYLLQEAHES